MVGGTSLWLCATTLGIIKRRRLCVRNWDSHLMVRMLEPVQEYFNPIVAEYILAFTAMKIFIINTEIFRLPILA